MYHLLNPRYDKADVQLPALRSLINIVSGSDSQCKAVIDAGVLTRLHHMLIHATNETTRKETCLIISNIAAGPPDQVDAVLKCEGMLACMVAMLAGGEQMQSYEVEKGNTKSAVKLYVPLCSEKVRREICWALSNVVHGQVWEHVSLCMDAGMVEIMLDFVYHAYMAERDGSGSLVDDRVIVKALDAMSCMLLSGEKCLNALDDPSQALLHQMSSMQIAPASINKGVDSAYTSKVDLFQDLKSINAATKMFYQVLPHYSHVKGVEVVRSLAEGSSGYFGNCVSLDVCTAASLIAARWFLD